MEKERRQAIEKALLDQRTGRVLIFEAAKAVAVWRWAQKNSRYVNGRGLEAQEVLNTAAELVLGGKRKSWDGASDTFIPFMIGVIRSIVSNHGRSASYRVEKAGIPDEASLEQIPELVGLAPERVLLPDGGEVFETARELMKGDDDAQLWLLAAEEGNERDEIARELAISPKEADNIRGRIIYKMKTTYARAAASGEDNEAPA